MQVTYNLDIPPDKSLARPFDEKCLASEQWPLDVLRIVLNGATWQIHVFSHVYFGSTKLEFSRGVSLDSC